MRPRISAWPNHERVGPSGLESHFQRALAPEEKVNHGLSRQVENVTQKPSQRAFRPAVCLRCAVPFAKEELRLRPAGTSKTRLLHLSCAPLQVTREAVVNWSTNVGTVAASSLSLSVNSEATM